MKDSEGFDTSSVLLSFLLGGIVGAGLALLLAPQSGPETRRKIMDLADEVKHKANDYVAQARDTVSSTVEKGKSYVDQKKTLIAAAFEAGKEAYEKEAQK